MRTPRSTAIWSRIAAAIESGTDRVIDTTIRTAKTGKTVTSRTTKVVLQKAKEKRATAARNSCEVRLYKKYGAPRNQRELEKMRERTAKKCR
jgi:hypothetical protein